MEALACRRAISFSIEPRLQDVFKGDSEVIYKQFVLDSTCTAAFGHIIEDSRRLTTSLISASFSHVRHNENKVADKLAKLAKFFYEPQILLEDIHCDVTNLVILDRSLLSTNKIFRTGFSTKKKFSFSTRVWILFILLKTKNTVTK